MRRKSWLYFIVTLSSTLLYPPFPGDQPASHEADIKLVYPVVLLFPHLGVYLEYLCLLQYAFVSRELPPTFISNMEACICPIKKRVRLLESLVPRDPFGRIQSRLQRPFACDRQRMTCLLLQHHHYVSRSLVFLPSVKVPLHLPVPRYLESVGNCSSFSKPHH